jgi:hypothetical protein
MNADEAIVDASIVLENATVSAVAVETFSSPLAGAFETIAGATGTAGMKTTST